MINKPLIILAGGFGTRLQSILKGNPKPLADVEGKPFLHYLLENWVKNGFTDFIFSLHYEASKIIDYVEKNKSEILKDCKIRYYIEPTPMGTGGAISYILENFDYDFDFFVVNADTWVKDGYSIINKYSYNVIGLVRVKNTNRYGSVNVDKKNFIINFVEKNDLSNCGLINIGVYKFSSSIFRGLKKTNYSLENDLFPMLIDKKIIKGVLINTEFIDIGIPDDYYKFCESKAIINESI
jgi:D-glycero-alpha-D-manno-heptose 1-phosphate guanylyltransferase